MIAGIEVVVGTDVGLLLLLLTVVLRLLLPATLGGRGGGRLALLSLLTLSTLTRFTCSVVVSRSSLVHVGTGRGGGAAAPRGQTPGHGSGLLEICQGCP